MSSDADPAADADLVATLATVTGSLPGDQVELAVNALRRLRAAGPAAREALHHLVPAERFRAAMGQLIGAWGKVPAIDGSAVSLALCSARAAFWGPPGRTPEARWSGPDQTAMRTFDSPTPC